MKKIRFFVSMILMIAPANAICAHGQDSSMVVILSPRVGEVIDSSEREYYHLFRSVKDFNSAVILKLPDGRYECRFTVGPSTAQKLIFNEISEALVYNLAEKIEHYEDLKKDSYVMGSRRPVVQIGGKPAEWRYDRYSSSSDEDERIQTKREIGELPEVEVMTRSGVQYYGLILHVADSVLVIWTGFQPYDSNLIGRYAISVPSYTIDRVVLVKESKFVTGLGTGFLCGGALGAIIGFASGDDEKGLIRFSAGGKALLGGLALGLCGAMIGGGIGAAQGTDAEFIVEGNRNRYSALSPFLKENAIVTGMPPSQLRRLLEQVSKDPSPSIQGSSIEHYKPLSSPSPCKFHLSLSGAWILTSANNDIIQAFNSSGFGGRVENWFFGGWTDYPADHSKSLSWSVGCEYNLSGRVRSGFVLSNFPKQEISGRNGQYECVDGKSYNLMLEYVFEPSPLSLSEFAIAAGPSYNTLSVHGSLFGPFYSGLTNFKINKNVVGLYTRVSYDYYISRNASFQLRIEGRLVPGISIPETSRADTTSPSNVVVTTLKQHSIDFSEVGFSFGVRFHF